jgi:hypothetical protein
VAEGVRADRGGDASGLGVAGEDLAGAAVAVWLLQLDSNRNTAPARRWASMCRTRVSLNAAGRGTTRSFAALALGDPDAAGVEIDVGDPDPDELGDPDSVEQGLYQDDVAGAAGFPDGVGSS